MTYYLYRVDNMLYTKEQMENKMRANVTDERFEEFLRKTYDIVDLYFSLTNGYKNFEDIYTEYENWFVKSYWHEDFEALDTIPEE